MAGRTAWVVAVLAALALSAMLAAEAPLGSDYIARTGVIDTSRPQIDALAAGDISRFVHNQSPLGPVSLLVRAPFAALASPRDQRGRYRLGALVCLVALALAAVGAARVLVARGSPGWHAALVAATILLTPVVQQALFWGHPEELLTTALVIGGAACALRERPLAAGALTGLAIASKPWAVLAVLPIALIATRQRLRVIVLALGLGACLIAPLALAAPQSFRSAAKQANTVLTVNPMTVWWPMSNRHVTVDVAGRLEQIHRPRLPHVIDRSARVAIVLVSAALGVLLLRRRHDAEAGLGLLALVMLLRCFFDPGDQSYYHVPFVATLALWEGVGGRPPLMAIGVSVLMSDRALHALGSQLDPINAVYLAWSIPLLALLGWSVASRSRRTQPAAA